MNELAPPRISRGRAAATVIVGLTVAGALIGALWAWIAPPINAVIVLIKGQRVHAYSLSTGQRVHTPLGNEADNYFIAAFLLVGLVVAVAAVSAVLVWHWRPHRGPVLVAALAIGSAAAVGVAAGVGALLVRSRYGVIDIAGAPISPKDRVHYVTEAPPVFFAHSPLLIAASILFPAAVAALAYALIAVSTSRDDLGGWPPMEPVGPPPITMDDALQSAP